MSSPMLMPASARKERVLALAEELNVLTLTTSILGKNPSQSLPYHGNEHAMSVAELSLIGLDFLFQGHDSRLMRNIFIAGLLHDWDHTGCNDEEVNIQRAVDAVKIFEEENHEHWLTSDWWQVQLLIEATDSRKTPADRDTIGEKVIADADVLQNIVEDYQKFWNGLSKETGTVVDAVSTQIFLQNHSFNTEWGQDLVQHAPEVLGWNRI